MHPDLAHATLRIWFLKAREPASEEAQKDRGKMIDVEKEGIRSIVFDRKKPGRTKKENSSTSIEKSEEEVNH